MDRGGPPADCPPPGVKAPPRAYTLGVRPAVRRSTVPVAPAPPDERGRRPDDGGWEPPVIIAPPAPAESATTTTQSAQQVTLKAKVITINPSPDAVDVKDALQGRYCGEDSGNTCMDLEYMPVWTSPGQFGLGVDALTDELAAAVASGDEVTVLGFSEGAVVASQWLEAYLANPEDFEIPENLTFVVVGAGPTGVELAGAIKEIALKTLRKEFRTIDPVRDEGAVTCAAGWNAASCLSSSATRVASAWRSAWSASRSQTPMATTSAWRRALSAAFSSSRRFFASASSLRCFSSAMRCFSASIALTRNSSGAFVYPCGYQDVL